MKPPKFPVASCKIDVFQYLTQPNTSPQTPINIDNSFEVEVPQRQLLMDIENCQLADIPKLVFACYFEDTVPKGQLICQRIQQVSSKLSSLKKEIEKTNKKLLLQTAGFPSIRYDERRLWISELHSNSFSCFSRTCATSKLKKQKKCLII